MAPSQHIGTTMLFGLLVSGQSLAIGQRMRDHTAPLLYSILLKVAAGELPNELVNRIHDDLMELKWAEAREMFSKRSWTDAMAKFDEPTAKGQIISTKHQPTDRGVQFTYGSEWFSLVETAPDLDTTLVVYLTITHGNHGIGMTQMGTHIHIGGGDMRERGRWQLPTKHDRKASSVVSSYTGPKKIGPAAGNNQSVFHDVDGIEETIGLWDPKMAEREIKDLRLDLIPSREGMDATKPTLRIIQGFCRRG